MKRISTWSFAVRQKIGSVWQKLAYIFSSFLMLLALVLNLPLAAFATGDTVMGQEMIKAIVVVVCNIVMILGIIFVIIGLVKLVTAHANEDGPAQQKAATLLATGVVLVILPMILQGLDFPGKLGSAFTNYGSLPNGDAGATQ